MYSSPALTMLAGPAVDGPARKHACRTRRQRRGPPRTPVLVRSHLFAPGRPVWQGVPPRGEPAPRRARRPVKITNVSLSGAISTPKTIWRASITAKPAMSTRLPRFNTVHGKAPTTAKHQVPGANRTLDQRTNEKHGAARESSQPRRRAPGAERRRRQHGRDQRWRGHLGRHELLARERSTRPPQAARRRTRRATALSPGAGSRLVAWTWNSTYTQTA
jgi:hypothetical protein